MKSLEGRIEKLERRHGAKGTGRVVVWYANSPYDEGEPLPRPEVSPGDLFFEVHYVNPPPCPDVVQ